MGQTSSGMRSTNRNHTTPHHATPHHEEQSGRWRVHPHSNPAKVSWKCHGSVVEAGPP
eukprot:CAMPEP_0119374298 /NCGR_PEP_ID=MMETSP1334-20130426/30511_1 /TAXON_ID=127549 /ORGANISM="Calcidiscus leptoporus, Strain RCC1130" /LENGTH=57 /DNA_ID=CAMNT_0007392333 /DNA_START=429 /DNA_END=598 /DNA_ORIENTATION=-